MANNDQSKDLLFSKLLPALKSNPFSSEYEGNKPDTVDTYEEVEVNDILSALRSRLFARQSTYTQDSYATLNVMESLVLKHIDDIVKRFNCCSCDRCKCDVAAYALNNLPAKYIVADNKLVTRYEDEIPTRVIMNALVNAVIHVRSNPRH